MLLKRLDKPTPSLNEHIEEEIKQIVLGLIVSAVKNKTDGGGCYEFIWWK